MSGNGITPLGPTTLAEAQEFARLIASSELVPKSYRGRPRDVFLAIVYGSALGLAPLAALSGVAVISGRPCLWGDTLIALVRRHPDCLDVVEKLEGEGDDTVASCTVKRRGCEPLTRTFSVADARQAGLWEKRGRNGEATPWVTYPRRMLAQRARGFALRDSFPDALAGFISVEEAGDIPVDTAECRVVDTGPVQPNGSRSESLLEALAGTNPPNQGDCDE